MSEIVLGLDIGGANIKYAFSDGILGNIPFELWKYPENLSDKLESIPDWQRAANVGVTMTGELADCFESKACGVEAICHSTAKAFSNCNTGFYQTSGNFVDQATAIKSWQLTAAANWHALASLAGRVLNNCIVLDIGSTTTDIIPVGDGKPAAHGSTDLTRLVHGELLYTGAVRSPVCAIARTVDWKGHSVPVAQELFANMLDVYVILGMIEEDQDNRHTADGRPADKHHSYIRLARMLCAETIEISNQHLNEIALQLESLHLKTIALAVERILLRQQSLCDVVLTGEGSFLGKKVLATLKGVGQVLVAHDLQPRFPADNRPAAIGTASAVAFIFQQHLSQVSTPESIAKRQPASS